MLSLHKKKRLNAMHQAVLTQVKSDEVFTCA
ncbi:Uncharacterised protein [Vibrio cholerae]|nr:Uncharacterised protein [Vibrio cholerae]